MLGVGEEDTDSFQKAELIKILNVYNFMLTHLFQKAKSCYLCVTRILSLKVVHSFIW